MLTIDMLCVYFMYYKTLNLKHTNGKNDLSKSETFLNQQNGYRY